MSFFYNLIKFLGGNVSNLGFKYFAAGLVGFSFFYAQQLNYALAFLKLHPMPSMNALRNCYWHIFQRSSSMKR